MKSKAEILRVAKKYIDNPAGGVSGDGSGKKTSWLARLFTKS